MLEDDVGSDETGGGGGGGSNGGGNTTEGDIDDNTVFVCWFELAFGASFWLCVAPFMLINTSFLIRLSELYFELLFIEEMLVADLFGFKYTLRD